jgi:hypothetical protein
MAEQQSKRQMKENEVIFREHNERVNEALKRLKKTAREEGLVGLLPDTDGELRFYCECADENCRGRILVKPSLYHFVHKNRNHFIIIPGHDAPGIENIVAIGPDFCVVEKTSAPPPTDKLNKTKVNNR